MGELVCDKYCCKAPIVVAGITIGTFTQYDVDHGETNHAQQYDGVVPGHGYTIGAPPSQSKELTLLYCNDIDEFLMHTHGVRGTGFWCRQDHYGIPFP